uniref:Hflx-type G domain-containing protein n=1 Tax=Solanum lycopersicum TaxID=4081 RepID=A0A494G908_SOLLC
MLEKKEHNYEKAVLVGVVTQHQDEDKLQEYMDELEFLAYTAGATVDRRFTQKLTQPDSKTFIGSGKAQEIKEYVKENEIGTVIFDDELSPSQLKNLERELEVKILDRTNLILDIFAQRATTSYARTQVELAQYQYLLPRLTRMWTHLERQKGGIGMRGPGETEIETDRRIIRDRISLLKDKLKTIDKQMATQRNNRGKVVRVALVGYTNVGKSTLMNALSKSEVFAENKLFATLDTTVRKVVIGNLPFLLTDTVGFIRKLPTQLVESFKSTLDEVREADLLIHVVDISHESFEDHIDSVNQILMEINAHQKPMIMIFNKIDDFSYEKKDEDDLTPSTRKNISLEEWKNTWMAKSKHPTVFISALTKENFPEMKKMIYDEKTAVDLKTIGKNLKNSKSLYNYEKLIFKYKAYPKSLDTIESRHLYYGRNFRSDLVSTTDEDFKALAEAFKSGDFDDCIKKGKILYEKDPTNLDVLLILLRAYDSKKDGSNFMHHLSQFRTLTDAVRSSGDGKSENTAYLVNSVGDEYILLNILNLGQDYTRVSKPGKGGMFDIWRKDNNTVFIKVLYIDF